MPHYLVQVAYTPEAFATMIKNPQNRLEKLRPVLEKLGGSFVQAWFAFGEYDIIAICELPDNVNAAAFSIAVHAGGACKGVKTTPLMSVEEGMEALKKAADCGYQPPQ
jgi:uncharacterized protein with GYD domain